MKTHSSLRLALLVSLVCCAVGVFAVNSNFRVEAQGCVEPDSQPRSTAWSQNAPVMVSINSNQFSQAEFDCLRTAFTNWQNSNGQNMSMVTFNVVYSPTMIVTTDANGTITSSTGNNVYQVNKAAASCGVLNP